MFKALKIFGKLHYNFLLTQNSFMKVKKNDRRYDCGKWVQQLLEQN